MGPTPLPSPGVIIKGSLDFQLEVNQLGTGSGPASMRMRVLLLVFTQVFFNLENYHLIEEKEFHETFHTTVSFITIIAIMLSPSVEDWFECNPSF